MKIIFLNAWYGTQAELLKKFLEEQKETTDVFCFMEADSKFRSQYMDLSLDYVAISADKEVNNENGSFQTTLVKKGKRITGVGTILDTDHDMGYSLWTQIEGINIANVHGVAQPGEKLDNPKRLAQSRGIIDYMAKIKGPTIIGGDFNLDKDTESVAMFEKAGYRNLIKDFNIETTRNHLVWDLYPERKQLFADFLFVSQEVKVKSFEVPKNEISDHLPLILEIED